MNKQYVKGVQKRKVDYMIMMMGSKMVIIMLALLFDDRAGDNVSSVQGTEEKK